MIHKIKLFLYYHSFHVLFKKYWNKRFKEQLVELIGDILEDLDKDPDWKGLF